MEIIPLSIPTPFYVGDVNVYLIKSDPVTLIDVGPKTPHALAALTEKLKRNGVSFADIRRIVLTHSHEDHCGLAKTIKEASPKAEVMIHDWETGHLFGRVASEEHRKIMNEAGVPGEVFEQLRATYERVSLLTDSLADSELTSIAEDDELEFEDGVLRVLHTPGHTPGSCSFYRAADKTMICGDCVLKRITPNPVVSAHPLDPNQRFESLATYLKTLERIRDISPTLIHGGHGESIDDYEEIYGRYVRAVDKRQQKVLGFVERGGVTAWEIARKVFPDAIDQDVHRFLAISEAIAHLDYAVGEERLESRVEEGVYYYFSS